MKGVNTLSEISKEEREIEEWNSMKLMGKNRYVWYNRVLKWGVPITIITSFFLCVLINQPYIRTLTICFCISLTGQYFDATSLWRKYNKKYNV